MIGAAAAALLAALLVGAAPAPKEKAGPSAKGAPRVLVAEFDGVISPVAAEFIGQAVRRAEDEGFEALVLRLDTPGGLDLSMRDAVKAILGSRVPVVVYVAPSGARAASAGVFIAMAAHVAAMAPGTNIGAAHPVMIGGGGLGGDKKEKPDEKLETKVTSDATAYLRSIARQRGRNETWAANAVTSSTSTPAAEAVALGVVDLLAEDLDALLADLDGRRVEALKVTLRTAKAETTRLEMTRRQKVLATLSDPNIAVILLSIGAAGIFIELYNPGLILPGIVGVIALLMGFYSFQTLSANFAGVALLLFGLVLLLLEIKVVSYGLLTLGGVAALLLGFLMLFNQPGTMGLSVDWTVIASTVGGLVSLTVALAWLYARAALRKPETGSEELLGMEGVAKGRLSPGGNVLVHGELWKAEADAGEIGDGEPVVVVSQKGLTLRVRRKG